MQKVGTRSSLIVGLLANARAPRLNRPSFGSMFEPTMGILGALGTVRRHITERGDFTDEVAQVQIRTIVAQAAGLGYAWQTCLALSGGEAPPPFDRDGLAQIIITRGDVREAPRWLGPIVRVDFIAGSARLNLCEHAAMDLCRVLLRVAFAPKEERTTADPNQRSLPAPTREELLELYHVIEANISALSALIMATLVALPDPDPIIEGVNDGPLS